MSDTEALKKIGTKLTPELFPGCESHGNADAANDDYWECYIRHVTQTTWSVFDIVNKSAQYSSLIEFINLSFEKKHTHRIDILEIETSTIFRPSNMFYLKTFINFFL